MIVTNNRCGSKAFSKWLKNTMEIQPTYATPVTDVKLSYDIILNPMEVNDFYDKENTIVVLTFDDYKKFIKKFKFIPEEKFDIVICLKRANTREQAESYVKMLECGYSNRPYILSKEWILKNENIISKFDKKFKKDNNDMNSVFGLHIDYDLLYNDEYPKDFWHVVSYIGIIGIFDWTLKRTFKLRRISYN